MSASASKAMIVAEAWTLLRDLIQPEDYEQSADSLVSMMIDYDVSLDDIAHHFSDDGDIMRAVAFYRDEDGDDEIDDDFGFDGDDD